MMLGKVSYCEIKCAHIWPKWTKGSGLEVLELSQNDVNNPRNFLRLHEAIEKAFDRKRLYFERMTTSDPSSVQLKVIILDPTLLLEAITKGKNDVIHFNDINGASFDYVFYPTQPFMRLLAQYAIPTCPTCQLGTAIPTF